MSDLAARIEQAEGPSRELDAEIAVSVLGMERDGAIFYGEDEDFVLERNYYSIEGSARELPAFTASLDAAMTLVPDGCYPYVDFKEVTCFIRSFEGYDTAPPAYSIVAPTAAQALAAACIRAMEADRGE